MQIIKKLLKIDWKNLKAHNPRNKIVLGKFALSY